MTSAGCFYAADQGRRLEEKILRIEKDRMDPGTLDRRLSNLEARSEQFREDIDGLRKVLQEQMQVIEIIRQNQESSMMERSVLENRVLQLEDRVKSDQARVAALEKATGAKPHTRKPGLDIGTSITPSIASEIPAGNAAFGVIVANIQAGEWVKAHEGIEAVLARDPSPRERAQAQLLLGHLHFRQKLYSDAILVFDEVAKKYQDFPEAAEALYFEAKAFQEKGNRDTASAFYKKLIKRYPDSPFKAKAQADLKLLGS